MEVLQLHPRDQWQFTCEVIKKPEGKLVAVLVDARGSLSLATTDIAKMLEQSVEGMRSTAVRSWPRPLPLPERRLLTSEGAASYCGFSSVNGFQAYIKVPPVNFGRMVRYDRADLDAYLETKKEPATPKGSGQNAD